MMLAFQNLHQFVFNFSQVTSAVSSYIRVTSTSVKRKPEVDVYCSESFLHTLKTFQQSENAKLFRSLPNVKFGPRLEDIQWVYCNDVNFKFTAGKSVNETDFYISFDKKSFENLSPDSLSFSKLDDRWGKQQKKIITQLENHLREKSIHESFVSKKSFDENKNSSQCGNSNVKLNLNKTSSVFSNLVGNVNSYTISPNVGYIQSRGFKTKRVIELEEKTNPSFFSRFGRLVGVQGSSGAPTIDPKEKSTENPVMSKMMADSQPEDKLKMKVSFAEGYMVAANELNKSPPESIFTKLYSFTKNVCIFLLFALALASLLDGKRRIFPFSFGHHGEVDPEDIGVNFTDVKGIEEVKEELQEIVEFLRNPGKFITMGGKLPKGVLLVGPPGTGKTLMARAIAGEANVPFFHASGSEFDETFVGEGARRIRNLFRSAKAKAPCIIFIDEIDCVGSKRKSTMLHPYANQTINQLLSEMDGFIKNEGVIILGATNRKDDLDPALLRPGRFDVEVMVPLPDLDGRKEILELYVSKISSKDIDVLKMAKATPGCTGADLEAIVNHAAIRAAAEGAPYVTMAHLENAQDKIIMGPERKSKSDEGSLITAVHEGGHTVVAYFTEGVGPINKVTIVPRGLSLGHTSMLTEKDEMHKTKAMCLAHLDVLMGGRAAEELIFGLNKITANASDDLEKATRIASEMVKKYGMSEKVGLRTLKSSDREDMSVNEYGQVITDQVDMEVKRLVQESYERAKSILKKHAKEHKLLADALIKYKTLTREDVRAILGDNTAEKGTSPSATIVN